MLFQVRGGRVLFMEMKYGSEYWNKEPSDLTVHSSVHKLVGYLGYAKFITGFS